MQVEIWHQEEGKEEGKKMEVYALLDECCQGALIREDVLEMLQIENTSHTYMSLKTVVGEDEGPSISVENLMVRGVEPFSKYYDPVEIKLPTTHTRTTFAMGPEDHATPSHVKNLDYLKFIEDKIPELDPSVPFGLMIGGDCPLANETIETIHSQNNGPYAKRTLLGWIIIGPINREVHSQRSISSNLTKIIVPNKSVCDNSIPTHHFRFQSYIAGTYNAHMLKEMYTKEFHETNSERKALSREDERFIKIMDDNIQREGKNYMLPIPFRNPNLTLPDNKIIATRRLTSLKRSFQIQNFILSTLTA